MIRDWPHLGVGHRRDLPSALIEHELLVRTRPTAPQSTLGRDRRADNIKHAFDLARRDGVENKNILLVDDVYTTGATVNECARLLLDRGAQKVDVLTLARAV